MVTITESAQDYLAELLSKQDDALGVRVFINQPGTPRSETCIAYCREGDLEDGDEVKEFAKFTVWYEAKSSRSWRMPWWTIPRIAWGGS
jgi:Fe/S biogenesis protein NfuA